MKPTQSNWDATRQLFEAVAAGQLGVEDALRRCQSSATESIAGATVDLGRPARCGFGEVIYGPGKSAELIQQIALHLLQCQSEVLVTRCDAEVAEAVAPRFDHHRYAPRARTLRIAARPIAAPSLHAADRPTASAAGPVAVVTAGSTDAAVAEEAAETLAWMGVAVDWIEDVGVAGPQRVLAVVHRLRAAAAVVVVAGMEGALPSVVAGHVACPVIAVPTSVGYGAALSGLTPLLAMLTSCAANVAVVNIDAGFKGGYLAGMIAAAIRQAGDAAGKQ